MRVINIVVVAAAIILAATILAPLRSADAPGGVGLVNEVRQLRERVTQVELAVPPIGSVVAHVGVWPLKDTEGRSVDNGWIACDGQPISDQKFEGLRNTLGIAQADGALAPNFHGKFLRGASVAASDGKRSGMWLSANGKQVRRTISGLYHSYPQTGGGEPDVYVVLRDENQGLQKKFVEGNEHGELESIEFIPPNTEVIFLVRYR